MVKAAAISTIEPYEMCNTAKITAEAHIPNFFNKNPLKNNSSAKGAINTARGMAIKGSSSIFSLTFPWSIIPNAINNNETKKTANTTKQKPIKPYNNVYFL